MREQRVYHLNNGSGGAKRLALSPHGGHYILRKRYTKRAARARQAPDLFPASTSKSAVPVECLCASNM
jgi:hypothetical protein